MAGEIDCEKLFKLLDEYIDAALKWRELAKDTPIALVGAESSLRTLEALKREVKARKICP